LQGQHPGERRDIGRRQRKGIKTGDPTAGAAAAKTYRAGCRAAGQSLR
jgi:hypothetical protein